MNHHQFCHPIASDLLSNMGVYYWQDLPFWLDFADHEPGFNPQTLEIVRSFDAKTSHCAVDLFPGGGRPKKIVMIW